MLIKKNLGIYLSLQVVLNFFWCCSLNLWIKYVIDFGYTSGREARLIIPPPLLAFSASANTTKQWKFNYKLHFFFWSVNKKNFIAKKWGISTYESLLKGSGVNLLKYTKVLRPCHRPCMYFSFSLWILYGLGTYAQSMIRWFPIILFYSYQKWEVNGVCWALNDHRKQE